MVKFLRCNKTYAIQVVHVSSSEDSPIKDGITQGKRKMSRNLSKRKLFVAVDDGKKDSAWYSCKLVVVFNKLPVHGSGGSRGGRAEGPKMFPTLPKFKARRGWDAPL